MILLKIEIVNNMSFKNKNINYNNLILVESSKNLIDLLSSPITHYFESLDDDYTIYNKRMHNICCDNCHSHVARVLNILEYKGRTNYTMIDIWWICLIKSKYVSVLHILFTYVFWIFVGIIYGFSFLFRK